MKKMVRYLVLLLLFFSLVLTGYGQEYGKKVSIAAASPGGSFYITGAVFGQVLKEKLGLDVSVEVTGGGRSNVQLIEQNGANFGLTSAEDTATAWEGLGWAEGKKHKNIRSLFPLYPSIFQGAVLASKNVNTLYDIEGLVVNLGPAGSTHDMMWRNIFNLLGIHPAKIYNLPWGDALDQMRDGKIDGIFMTSSVPNPSIVEISSIHDVVILGLGDEDADKVIKEYPFVNKYRIEPNAYKNQNNELVTVAGWVMMITNKDQPEKLIYDVVKTTFDNKNILIDAYKGMEGIKTENVPNLNIPLHIGAYNYYKEQGVEIPKSLIPSEVK